MPPARSVPSHAVVPLVAVLLGCSPKTPPAPAVPDVVDAPCLVPEALGAPLVLPEVPATATQVAPGAYLWEGELQVEMDTLIEQRLIVERDGVVHAWAVGGFPKWEYGEGDIEVVQIADVTGDGSPEILVEVDQAMHTRPTIVYGVSSSAQAERLVWDPSGARILARVPVLVSEGDHPAPICDNECLEEPLPEGLLDPCASCTRETNRPRAPRLCATTSTLPLPNCSSILKSVASRGATLQ